MIFRQFENSLAGTRVEDRLTMEVVGRRTILLERVALVCCIGATVRRGSHLSERGSDGVSVRMIPLAAMVKESPGVSGDDQERNLNRR